MGTERYAKVSLCMPSFQEELYKPLELVVCSEGQILKLSLVWQSIRKEVHTTWQAGNRGIRFGFVD